MTEQDSGSNDFSGYIWDKYVRKWSLETDRNRIILEPYGDGEYVAYSSVDENLSWPEKHDSFKNGSVLLVRTREEGWFARHRLSFLGEKFSDTFHEINYDKIVNHQGVGFYTLGAFNVSYSENGEMIRFNGGSSGLGSSLSFDFEDNTISTISDSEIVHGNLQEVIARDEKILFNERYISITRDDEKTTVEVMKPTIVLGDDVFTALELQTIAPNRIDGEQIIRMIQEDGHDWTTIPSLVPIRHKQNKPIVLFEE